MANLGVAFARLLLNNHGNEVNLIDYSYKVLQGRNDIDT